MTDVDLVLEFLNTVSHETHTDVLDDPTAWHRWLATHALTEGTGDVRAVRDALRAAVGDVIGDAVPPAAVSAPVTIDLPADGTPRLTAPDVVGAVLVAASRLVVRGTWARVKVCPARDCRWAFYDRSRNQSRTWCAMRVCGNRAKARRRSGQQLRDRVDH